MIDNQLNWAKDNFENIETAWEGDLWHRRRLGEQLTRYVDRLNCGAVLTLDARWGEGKTWFVRHWAKHLTDTEHNVIYLDAFANDYLEDPFLVITSEITNILKKDKSTKKRVSKLIELSASVGTALLPSLPKVALTLGLHLVGAGLLSGVLQQGYESAKDGIDTLSEEASDRIKESIQDKIAGHEAEKKTLKEFKKYLAETVEKLDKPLVFIIDELDRCRPDFSIRLIERIKHFFDIPRIVFVLVMDKTQFTKVICHNYGYDETLGEEYLSKFIDFKVSLPLINKLNPKEIVELPILKKLFESVGEFSDDVIFFFYKSLRGYITPREMKKRINTYALLKTGDSKKDMFLVLALQTNAGNLLRKFDELRKEIESQLQQQNISHHNIQNFFKNN
ncbi:P-loop NTPase fold protein [Acinetobacter sp. YH12096]|uniref:KAP family P-loop NTPase fold protein n=1 Tax=Acinetobacter sp. YH12096 TaxID=2601085 RepID=UPI0015D2F730|nr:P-loop NTPase fold protein [Acinetobacter sp. YH12096]